MDPSTLKRDAAKVREALAILPDGSVVAKRPVKIYIPERFVEKGLAEIGSDVFALGVYAIVVDDAYYAVSKIAAMMQFKPTTISTRKIGDSSFEEFFFDKGSVILPTTDLVKSNTLVYYILDFFVSNGAVPWYLSYEDVATLCDTAAQYAGMNLTGSHAVLGMMAAAIARDPQHRTQYYRHTLDTSADKTQKPVAYVPLRNITMGATNTTSRLQGAHWSDGLTSALANPSTKLARVEQLLRS